MSAAPAGEDESGADGRNRNRGAAAAPHCRLGRARPLTLKYRASNCRRRHAWGVAAVCGIAASLVMGLAAALYEARLARHRYRDVRQLASRFLFDFDDSIKNLPGTTRSRE